MQRRAWLMAASSAIAATALTRAATSDRAIASPSVGAFLQQLERSLASLDVNQVLALYSDDPATARISGGKIFTGLAAIRARFNREFGNYQNLSVRFGQVNTSSLGNGMVLVHTDFFLSGTSIRSNQLRLRGATSFVLEPNGSSWRILHEHSSVSLLP